MLTLDSKIVIDGVETTPREWMLNDDYPKNFKQFRKYKVPSLPDGFDDEILEIFHDYISNEGITYEII